MQRSAEKDVINASLLQKFIVRGSYWLSISEIVFAKNVKRNSIKHYGWLIFTWFFFFKNMKLSLIFGPYHSISTISENWGNWNQPHASVCTKYLHKVFIGSDVIYIRSCIRISLSLKIVKSWWVFEHKFNVEFEEKYDSKEENYLEDDSCDPKNEGNRDHKTCLYLLEYLSNQ